MSQAIKIIGIAGSLRKASLNRMALKAAQNLVPAGATLEILELDGLPMYNQDDEANPPATVVAFKDAMSGADAILFVTPEYNYSIPGALKNAIDWGTRPYGKSSFSGKTGAIMGASMGRLGTARAQSHLRQICVEMDMMLVSKPEVMIASAHEHFDAEGKLTDAMTEKLIKQLLAKLVDLTLKLKA